MEVEVDFLGSFNVAYRKDALEAVGGFDEAFRHASGEDNDLAYRLHDEGGTLRFCREAVVRHYHPERLVPYLRTQRRHGFWRMKLYAKHPGRSGGDRYAGVTDLAGPPTALVAGCLAVLFLLNALPAGMPSLLAAAVMILFLQSLVHLPKTIDPALPLRPHERLAFHVVLTLRDYARGIGLVEGVFTFMILRQETAA